LPSPPPSPPPPTLLPVAYLAASLRITPLSGTACGSLGRTDAGLRCYCSLRGRFRLASVRSSVSLLPLLITMLCILHMFWKSPGLPAQCRAATFLHSRSAALLLQANLAFGLRFHDEMVLRAEAGRTSALDRAALFLTSLCTSLHTCDVLCSLRSEFMLRKSLMLVLFQTGTPIHPVHTYRVAIYSTRPHWP
jgi:hypothetical protein